MLGNFIADVKLWALQEFAASTLPDKRLNDRLVAYAALQATKPAGSTTDVCDGNKADREGAYRLLENRRVKAEDIDAGPFTRTVMRCEGRQTVLAIQDTTSAAVCSNELREGLISTGSPTGFLVHSVLMADGDTGEVIGLIDQLRWTRSGKNKAGSQKKDKVPEDRESAKWLVSDMAVRSRLGDTKNVISVADREADIYSFLSYQIKNYYRFVIRAKCDRQVEEGLTGVFDAVRNAPFAGGRVVRIEQRGPEPVKIPKKGRPARVRRDMKTTLQAMQCTIHAPRSHGVKNEGGLVLNVVRVSEVLEPGRENEQALEWVLLTSESINTLEQVVQVVEIYEKRWIIEEFHKCWKTGCRVESRPLQSLEAVERMMAITAPIAVRILQLQTAARTNKVDKSAETILNKNEWQCLWSCTETKPIPASPPSTQWALHAVAKLGSWYDSKGTGRIGWITLWRGWNRFQERLQGWMLGRQLMRLEM
jgi:hypothetical protein